MGTTQNIYEYFRPQLEEMIRTDALKRYVKERINCTNVNPPISTRFCDEVPEQLLLYFAGTDLNNTGQSYPNEIFGAARNLLEELETSPESAKDSNYVGGLAFLLEKGMDEPSNKIALDLLLKKGRPKVDVPYFGEEGEAKLINLFVSTYSQPLDGDRKTRAKELFSGYVTNFPSLEENARAALGVINI